MPWPPANLPVPQNWTDATVAATVHAGAHNHIGAALDDIVTQVSPLGKYVAVGYGGNPTYIDPAAADWAAVVAGNYGWVQFAFGTFTQVFVGNGANAVGGFQVTATGASFTAVGPNNAAVTAEAGAIGRLVITGETGQTDALLDIQDVDTTSILEVTGDRKLGFYAHAPVAQQTGVAVNAAGIHAALVALGLITA